MPVAMQDGSSDPSVQLRKLSEDQPRKRLTDVQEADESGVDNAGEGGDTLARDRKASCSSVASDIAIAKRTFEDLSTRKKKSSDGAVSSTVDPQWDARRLSEAGVRRSSDASIVLTEDTDSFIIGDRIWVGGTKPGQIAYIGETQFAPGEWAGIVLDEPVGKNDGSVAGIRYFQCESKRGVFSRLTRLTREPILEDDEDRGENTSVKTSPRSNGGPPSGLTSPRRPASSLSPASSLKELSLRRRPITPTQGVSATQNDLKLGDRVIVMSSMGSKAGVLRYIGTTEFAPGEWCGVELDDPLGKNDGSVEGKRYFECEPKFGLFAPVHKVSKSPSSRRVSGSCAIHRTGLTPVRRAGSRESVASATSGTSSASRTTSRVKLGVTSLASQQRSTFRTSSTPITSKTSLQDVLRDKDQQIEKLLRERQLERTELMRAATQADEAEQKLAIANKEFVEYRSATEMKLKEIEEILLKLQKENRALLNQLDDERKKYEDLQFRFEEETINKGDLEATNISLEQRVKELENQLSAITDTSKEIESLRQQHREECEIMHKQHQAELEALALTHGMDSEKLRQQAAELSHQLEEARAELVNKIDMMDLQSQQAAENESELKKEIEELKKIIMRNENDATQERDSLVTKLEQELKAVRSELKQQIDSAKETEQFLNKQVQQNSELLKAAELKLANTEAMFTAKIDEKSALVLKLQEKEVTLLQKLEETEKVLKEHEESLVKAIAAHNSEINEKTALMNEMETEIERLSNKLKEAENSLAASNDNFAEVIKKHAVEINEKTETIQQLEEKEIQLVKKLQDSSDLIKHKEVEVSEIIGRTAKEISEKDEMIKNLQEQTRKKEEEVIKLTQELDIYKKESELSLQKIKEEHFKEIEEKKSCINNLEIQLNLKEEEIRNVKNISSDQNEDLLKKTELIKKLQDDVVVLNIKFLNSEESGKELSCKLQSYELQIGDLQRKLQAAEDKYSQLSQQKQKLDEKISDLMNSTSDSSVQLSKLNAEIQEKELELEKANDRISSANQEIEMVKHKLQQVTETSQKTEFELKHKLQEVEQQKEKIEKSSQDKIEELKILEKELRNKAEKLKAEAECRETEHKHQISEEKSKIIKLSEEISLKENENKILKEELERKLEDTVRDVNEKEREYKEKIEALLKTIQGKDEEIRQKIMHVTKIREELESIKKIEEEKAETDEKLKEAQSEELEKIRAEKQYAESVISEKDAQILAFMSEVNRMKQEKETVEANLMSKNADLDMINVQISNLQNEKTSFENVLKSKEEEILQLQNDRQELTAKISDLLTKVKSAESMLSETGKQVTEKEVALKTELKLMQIRAETAEASLTEKERQLAQQNASLSAEIDQLKQRMKVAEEQKAERERLLLEEGKSHDAQLTELKRRAESVEADLKEQLSQLLQKDKKIETAAADIGQLKILVDEKNTEVDDLKKKLSEADSERQRLQQHCNEVTKSFGETVDLSLEIKNLQQLLLAAELREQELIRSKDAQKLELEAMLGMTKSVLHEKEKQYAKEKDEMLRLEEERKKAQQYKAMLDKIEYEKKQLEKQVSNMNATVSQSKLNANIEDPALQKLIEEKEEAQGQINFLNSVIVDMQRKNEALKARVEILEMGVLPADVDAYNLNGTTPRTLPPRLYCDICEEFDQHDTEDCPRQSTSSPPPTLPHRPHKTDVKERPYCEICEVFGHETADCDDGETF